MSGKSPCRSWATATLVSTSGSSVTGRLRQSSDIDVAIDAVRVLPSALLAELRERLEESAIPYDVDIVDLSAASPEIRSSVEREGLLWRG